MSLAINKTWVPLDIDLICRSFEQAKDLTFPRQKTAFRAVRALERAINHLCATAGSRIIFQQAISFTPRETASRDPLNIWRYPDLVKNNRTQNWRIAMVPRTSGTGDSYAQRQSDATAQTVKDSYVAASVTFPADVVDAGFVHQRGALTDANANDGVSTFNNASIVDICVQAGPLPSLDITIHDFAIASGAVGYEVLQGALEQLRAAFFEVRAKYLPIVHQWSAIRGAAAWDTPATSTKAGLVATSTTFTNLLDNTSTTRTATSPGLLSEVVNMGIGNATKANGTKVPLLATFYAKLTTGTGTGEIRMIGPDHVASNQVDTTTIGAEAWYDSPTGAGAKLYLNSTVDITDVASERNKIDLLGRCTDGGAEMHVWAYDIWNVLEL